MAKTSTKSTDILFPETMQRLIREGVIHPPSSDEEYFDILELFKTFEEVSGEIVFMDAGAGDGRWLWRAARWAKHFDCILQVVGIEGDPGHFGDMVKNRKTASVPTSQCTLVEKALVGSNEKEVYFDTGSQDIWFGQAVSKAQKNLPLILQQDLHWWFGLPFRMCTYAAQPAIFCRKVKEMLRKPAGGVYTSTDPRLTDKTQKTVVEYSTIKVAATKLSTILKDYPLVHHVMMDIQGAEGEVIQECIKTANTKVRKFVIGTHSNAIDKQLPKIFRQHGWECVWAFPCNQISHTPAGEISFQDGVQVWRNPRIP